MNARDFFASVLPPDGATCVMVVDPSLPAADRKPVHKFFTDTDEAARYALSRPSGLDVYMALASFTKRRRLQENAKALKSVWLDVDCGAGKPYATKAAGVQALAAFLSAAKLPKPTTVVDSGGGLHVYWVFATALPRERWQRVAEYLKAACVQHGLQVDPAPTADSARVLRVPGTYNFKLSTPRPVTVLKHTPVYYTDTDLMPEALAVSPKLTAIQGGGITINDDLSGGIEKATGGPFYAEHIANACEVMKDALACAGAGYEEPFWNQQLQVLAFCEDGEHWAHEISKGHATYSATETSRKLDYKRKRGERGEGGPTLCKTLALSNPEACTRCPFSGKVKSPISLGVAPYTGVPFPYHRTDEGISIKDANDEWICFLPFKVLDANPIRDRETGELALHMILEDSKGRKMEPVLAYSSLSNDQRSLSKSLGRYGVTLHTAHYQRFQRFGVAWLNDLARNRRVRTPHDHMGWVADNEFAIGEELYGKTGGPTQPLHGLDPTLVGMYKTQGTFERWQGAAQHVIDHGDITLAICLATGFAAPLIRMTSVPAVVLAFVSKLSGRGKTTAMTLAQAIWANPVQAMFSLDDTYASAIRKLGSTKNLPAYWDELQPDHARQFVAEVVFRLTQGKEKSRMSRNATLQDSTNWETMMAVASNVSIMDQSMRTGGDSNAGMLRLMEFEVGPFNETAGAAGLLTNAARENYGHAGRLYAAKLVQDHDAISARVSAMQSQLSARLAAPADTRFWIAGIATVMVGAKLANELGLLRFPLAEIFARMVQVFKAHTALIAAEVVEQQSEPDRLAGLVHDFVAAHVDQGIVTGAMQVGPGKAPPDADKVLLVPRRSPLMWHRSDNPPLLRLPKRQFREWLLEHRPHAVRDMELLKAHLGAVEVRSTLGVHTRWEAPGRMRCLDIPLGSASLQGFDPAVPGQDDQP